MHYTSKVNYSTPLATQSICITPTTTALIKTATISFVLDAEEVKKSVSGASVVAAGGASVEGVEFSSLIASVVEEIAVLAFPSSKVIPSPPLSISPSSVSSGNISSMHIWNSLLDTPSWQHSAAAAAVPSSGAPIVRPNSVASKLIKRSTTTLHSHVIISVLSSKQPLSAHIGAPGKSAQQATVGSTKSEGELAAGSAKILSSATSKILSSVRP
mmetsp:Transcript_26916/g.48561  ORF Transcript_26916/g.48561 Transcript_26916/m.48561 type:complete len:214 (+) Transcript_26916:160-801(+)